MTTIALSHLKDDCLRHGYGRKRWWADELGVSPLTISHWLAGRQRPNGVHALHIQDKRHRLETHQRAKEGLALLFDLYYQKNDRYPPGVLSMMMTQILSADRFSSRELGFLSYLVERDVVSFSLHADPVIANRLGWMLEASNQIPSFSVQKTRGVQHILDLGAMSSTSRGMMTYVHAAQTPLGKKWKIFDCDLSQIRTSFL